MLRRLIIIMMTLGVALQGVAFAQETGADPSIEQGAVSWQQDFGVVSAIKVSGNVRIEAAAVLAAVQLRVGEQAEASKLPKRTKTSTAEVKASITAGSSCSSASVELWPPGVQVFPFHA